MSQVSRNMVKTWFETGDRPTQQQFYDWLESVLWYNEGSTLAYKKVETNNYAILPTDYLLSVANGLNNWGILLPSPVGITGKVYLIKTYAGADSGVLTVTSASGFVQDANGNFASFCITNTKLGFMSNGTDWELIQT